MPDAPTNDAPAPAELTGQLRRLAEQTHALVGGLTGPLRRIQVRHGETVIEIEWHDPAVVGRPDVGPGDGSPAVPTDGAQQRTPDRSAPPGPDQIPARDTGHGPGQHNGHGGDQAETRPQVRSPIVGTFYRAAEPGGQPFVAVGDRLRPGQVIGIVEAMKLMNEIACDRSGVVAAVLVADGTPVEYDQPLITLDPG
ncbi:acetyl-CoA carboxylase biotin carboxyl carrier protein subunit [Solwaraspora sp. WMMD406]|uniref:acetyl-CoA carboxylase biotin carboxyl carrier protein n=1 Tax=Solwaraspora sp. WMMD406 TaxID=3016095 RepID=UPI002417B03C|nr:biotin/lipoyl-containing protein [Solwaraspora sp. WMMD406]MDG4764060.1 acetyl-CoA carboxylase biotin carboxyl carrier protein subunit [Solwaraspora sp. WMMD406]